MAHIHQLSGLTEELVQLVTGFSPTKNADAFKTCKETSIKNLRHHRFARTNQFNVRTGLEGLIEKLQILNHDLVAEALETRLKELENFADAYQPEVLSLLLSLSDRPVEKSKIEHLNKLRRPTPPPPLTWKQILEDDPFTERGIWDDVDYRDDSSDEFSTLALTRASSTDGVSATGSTGDPSHLNQASSAVLISTDESILSDIALYQSWRSSDAASLELNELQLIREVIHSLLGLPSNVFENRPDDVLLMPRKGLVVRHCSQSAVNSVLQCLGVIASNLNDLREIVRRRTKNPILQSFIASITSALHEFEQDLMLVESRLVNPDGLVISSLLDVQAHVESNSLFLIKLSAFSTRIMSDTLQNPYKLIDYLLAEVSEAQFEGDNHIYRKFADMFFECLDIYLRPIATWMRDGTLDRRFDSLPIEECTEQVDLRDIWHAKFRLVYESDNLKAPRMIHRAMDTILSAGKDVSLIKELGLSRKLSLLDRSSEPMLNFLNVCGDDTFLHLMPFAESLSAWVEAWVVSHHLSTWPILQEHTTEQCRLFDSAQALNRLFLGANGAVLDDVREIVVSHLEGRSPRANTGLLESLLRTVISEHTAVDPRGIYLTLEPAALQRKGTHRFESVNLTLTCHWLVANIIRPSQQPTYRSAFHLLLQVKHGLNSLNSLRLRPVLTQANDMGMSNLALGVRHQLSHVLSVFLSHVTQFMFQIAFRQFLMDMKFAQGFNKLVYAHAQFVGKVANATFQIPALETALQALRSICDLAVLFSQAQQTPTGDKDSRTRRSQLKQMRMHSHQLTSALVSELRSAAKNSGGASDVGWETLANDLSSETEDSH